MADSHAVDRAQAAGYTVASTTGKVTGPLSAGALHRLQRIVETAGGRLEFTDNGLQAEKVLFAGVAGKEMVVRDPAVGTAGNAKKVVLAAAGTGAPAASDDGTTLTVNLGDASPTVADIVDTINADGFLEAELGDSYAARSAKAYCIFEDIAQAGDDLIFTGKTNGVPFTVLLRRPRGRTEEALTSVTVSVDDGSIIEIIVPATKTVANVKTAVEAHTAANALVAVTTAGTTTHAVDFGSDRLATKAGSFDNRGEVAATAVASQDLAGGTASDMALRVQPAVA